MEERRQDAGPTTEREANRSKRMRGLLAGALVGLLIAGGAYYFLSQRATDRSEPGSEQASTSTGAQAPATQAPGSRQGRDGGGVVERDASSRPATPSHVERDASSPPATPGQPKASSQPSGSPAALPPAATAARSEDPAQLTQNEPPQPARSESPRQPDPSQAAPATGTDPARSMQDQTASLPVGEVLFVQKSRVNIRSQPRSRAKIVGSAPKGRRVEVIRRDRSWIQIRTDGGDGWVNRRMVGPQAP
jgi:hypothetical protein